MLKLDDQVKYFSNIYLFFLEREEGRGGGEILLYLLKFHP